MNWWEMYTTSRSGYLNHGEWELRYIVIFTLLNSSELRRNVWCCSGVVVLKLYIYIYIYNFQPLILSISRIALTHRNIAPAFSRIMEEIEKAPLWLGYTLVPLWLAVARLLDDLQSTTPWRHVRIYHQTVSRVFSWRISLDCRERQEDGRPEIGRKSPPSQEPATL